MSDATRSVIGAIARATLFAVAFGTALWLAAGAAASYSLDVVTALTGTFIVGSHLVLDAILEWTGGRRGRDLLQAVSKTAACWLVLGASVAGLALWGNAAMEFSGWWTAALLAGWISVSAVALGRILGIPWRPLLVSLAVAAVILGGYYLVPTVPRSLAGDWTDDIGSARFHADDNTITWADNAIAYSVDSRGLLRMDAPDPLLAAPIQLRFSWGNRVVTFVDPDDGASEISTWFRVQSPEAAFMKRFVGSDLCWMLFGYNTW